MKNLLAVALVSMSLGACSTMPSEVFTGGSTERPSDRCGYIGCSTGGLAVYPHEEFSATRLPQRWYNWDWGESPTAYPPGSPKYEELKQAQIQMLRAKGLDPMGRPLPR